MRAIDKLNEFKSKLADLMDEYDINIKANFAYDGKDIYDMSPIGTEIAISLKEPTNYKDFNGRAFHTQEEEISTDILRGKSGDFFDKDEYIPIIKDKLRLNYATNVFHNEYNANRCLDSYMKMYEAGVYIRYDDDKENIISDIEEIKKIDFSKVYSYLHYIADEDGEVIDRVLEIRRRKSFENYIDNEQDGYISR